MSYEVFARKWRPQRFEDVVGQAPVVQTLTNAIRTGRIAHAYLFVGPRGIGKTSLARIFAKALNCAAGQTVTPCGTCDSCREIADGRNLDVMEIDGASNTGVDQVRDLRDTVKYVPTRGRFKIYLIDEVHMLSLAAFNALLKTLEEPPPHVKFFFATTEPDRIPATILSRCQRFDLRRIAVREIVERLELVAKTEKIEVDRDALLAIARGSEGSLRDAESALDQIVSFQGNRIGEAEVLSVFGLVARRTLEDLAGSVLGGDVKAIIETLAELDNAGKDLRRLVIELIDHFRNILVCLHVPGPGPGLDLLEGQIETLRRQAGATDPDRVLRIARILAEAEERMRHTLSKRVLLDTTLIRCARAAAVPTVEEIIERLERLGAREDPAGFAGPAAASPQAPRTDAAGPPVSRAGPALTAGPTPSAAAAGNPDAASLRTKWADIVAKMAELSSGSHRLLADMRPVAVEGDRAIVGFDPEFAEEVEELRGHRNAKLLTQVICGALGRQMLVEFRPSSELAEHTRRVRAARERPVDADAYGVGSPAEGKTGPRKNWHKDPAVQKVTEILGGQILEVRE